MAKKARLAATWYRLTVKVRPGASRSAVINYDGKVLHVDVAAPAVENRANEKLVSTLADALDVGVTSIVVLRGQTSRIKTIGIALEPTAVAQWLSKLSVNASAAQKPGSVRGTGGESSRRSE
jgi:uncharacterized protein (TIGR00251 family)